MRYVDQGSNDLLFLPSNLFCIGTFPSPFSRVTRYIEVGVCKTTGFRVHRCLRSTSALEGYHLHLRASRDPRARHAGPRVQNAESIWFDWRWNIRATVAARKMSRIDHEHLWVRDMLVDVLRGTLLHGKVAEVKNWRRVDTTKQPTVPLGFAVGSFGVPVNRGENKGDGGEGGDGDGGGVGIQQPHSSMKAADWTAMVLGHAAPVQARNNAAIALSDPTACAAGDSNALLGSTGQLFLSSDLSTFAATVSAKVDLKGLLHANNFSGVQARLRQGIPGGLALTATVRPVAEPSNYGSTTALPISLAKGGRALTVEGGNHALVVDETNAETQKEKWNRQKRESKQRKRKAERENDLTAAREKEVKKKRAWRERTGRN